MPRGSSKSSGSQSGSRSNSGNGGPAADVDL